MLDQLENELKNGVFKDDGSIEIIKDGLNFLNNFYDQEQIECLYLMVSFDLFFDKAFINFFKLLLANNIILNLNLINKKYKTSFSEGKSIINYLKEQVFNPNIKIPDLVLFLSPSIINQSIQICNLEDKNVSTYTCFNDDDIHYNQPNLVKDSAHEPSYNIKFCFQVEYSEKPVILLHNQSRFSILYKEDSLIKGQFLLESQYQIMELILRNTRNQIGENSSNFSPLGIRNNYIQNNILFLKGERQGNISNKKINISSKFDNKINNDQKLMSAQNFYVMKLDDIEFQDKKDVEDKTKSLMISEPSDYENEMENKIENTKLIINKTEKNLNQNKENYIKNKEDNDGIIDRQLNLKNSNKDNKLVEEINFNKEIKNQIMNDKSNIISNQNKVQSQLNHNDNDLKGFLSIDIALDTNQSQRIPLKEEPNKVKRKYSANETIIELLWDTTKRKYDKNSYMNDLIEINIERPTTFIRSIGKKLLCPKTYKQITVIDYYKVISEKNTQEIVDKINSQIHCLCCFQ